MSQRTVCGPPTAAVDWQDWGAACVGEDPALFFAPDYWETTEQKRAREARAKLICRTCPVQAQCLEFGLAASEGHGVWGGFNESERRRIARLRARKTTVAEPAATVA